MHSTSVPGASASKSLKTLIPSHFKRSTLPGCHATLFPQDPVRSSTFIRYRLLFVIVFCNVDTLAGGKKQTYPMQPHLLFSFFFFKQCSAPEHCAYDRISNHKSGEIEQQIAAIPDAWQTEFEQVLQRLLAATQEKRARGADRRSKTALHAQPRAPALSRRHDQTPARRRAIHHRASQKGTAPDPRRAARAVGKTRVLMAIFET
jgi:hypothetical protein